MPIPDYQTIMRPLLFLVKNAQKPLRQCVEDMAKDMHTGERGAIEVAIQEQMTKLLDGKGIIIDTVLIKGIQLPPNLARALEEKLEAE